jgi:hypothetical protein
MIVNTLQDYNSDLQCVVPNITLLGQLPYDESDLRALRAALAPLFRDGAAEALACVGRRHDLPFALYLVLEGVYNYRCGDYWAGPREALGLADNYTAAAGALFRRALRRAGLPTFAHLGGRTHVTPILAHAGIPNYCLDDFFDLLDRAGRGGRAADAPTLLDEWAAEGFPTNIDRPVQRFLLNGGPIAEDFVDRCLELRRAADPGGLDLPRRVLEGFERWQARRGPRAERPAIRLARPRLTLDPYGEGVTLFLPPIRFAAAQAPAVIVWQIAAGDRQLTETARPRRMGDDCEFAPRAAIPVPVAPRYVVAILADEAPLQSWTLDGPGDPPLLAFDPDTGELLRDRRREQSADYWLEPGDRWLVYPRGWSAVLNGTYKLVELPDGDGEWAAFAFETWRLAPDGRLELTAPDGRRAAFRAHDDAPPARPVLAGRLLLEAGIHEPFALYNGRPPDVHIPPGHAGCQPARWRVEIIPAAAADPPAPRACALDTLAHRFVILDDVLILPLDAPELLGAAPFGEFVVRLRGPYGRRAEFGLRFAPGLRFEDYPRLHLMTGDEPTAVRVIHPAGLELSSDEPGVVVGLPVCPPRPDSPAGVGRTVTAPAALARVPLSLRGDRGELAFDLPVYRLRFGLEEPERPDDFHWTTTPLRLHPEALDARHAARLRADLPAPPGAPPPAISWRLVDPDGRILREQPPDFRRSPRRPQTCLAEWLDAFRHAGRVAALQLVVDGATREATAVTIAYLLPTLELGEAANPYP